MHFLYSELGLLLPLFTENPRRPLLGNQPELIYAASCMSIRPALQTAAIPSDGSVDLLGWEGKTLRRMCSGMLR